MEIDKKDKKAIPPRTIIKKINIPDGLKNSKHWGLWKWSYVKNLWTKIPVCPKGNSIDAKLYNMTFDKAYDFFKKNSNLAGIGYHFSPEQNYFGIDFDDCVKAGKITDKKIKSIVKKLSSYREISVSGSGIHVIGKNAKSIENVDRRFIYCGTRYFTFTGNGTGEIKDIAKKVNKIFGKEKKINQAITGEAESDISISDLYRIVMNIRPDLPEPDWFNVCKAIHFKTKGSKAGWKLFNRWSAGEWCKKSQKYNDYNEPDCIAKWNRCKKTDKMVGLPTLRSIESYYPVSQKVIPQQIFKNKLKLLNYNSKFLTLKHLPKNLRKTAKEVARFNRVSVDPVITTMLMVFSAALNKKVKITEREGLYHNCSMGCIIGTPSGGRKSAIDRPIVYPFLNFEQEKMKEWEKNKTVNDAQVKVLKKQLKGIEADEAIEPDTQAEMIAAIQRKINKFSVPRPKLIESDATEERLSDSLHKNNETMFIHSDDARNTIKNITGRYDTTGENLYITGLTGDTYRRSRVKDDVEIVLYNPCINMSLKVQLDLLRQFVTKTSMRESGLLARMFIKVLDYDVSDQYRENQGQCDLDFTQLEDYNEAIEKILRYSGDVVQVRLSKKARKSRIEFSNFYADKIENEWKNYKDVSNKIVSLSVKMATVISVMSDPNILERSKNQFGITCFEISEKNYKKAKEIVIILMEQTLDVLNKLEKNDIITGAIGLLEKLETDRTEREKEEWTMSDMKFKYSNANRLHVESFVNCLLEAKILGQDEKKYILL